MKNERREAGAATLRSERSALNLTQAEFADRAGVVYGTYRRYESGERSIPMDAVAGIASALGITSADFMNLVEARFERMFAQ